MHRLYALLLALFFGILQPSIPAFAAGSAGAKDELPACCRKDGKHACGMAKTKRVPVKGVSIAAQGKPCPYFPTGKAAPLSTVFGDMSVPLAKVGSQLERLTAGVTGRPEPAKQKSFTRSMQKRGPPTADSLS